jgi:cell wall-associated NlpC family hydrolase
MRKAVAAASATLVIAAAIVVASPVSDADAVGYPGQDEIDSARAAVSDAQSGVAELDAAVADLAAALNEAETAAMIAEDRVTDAQVDKEQTAAELVAANKNAAQADAALAAARDNLATVAMDAYRTGGSFEQLKAITSSNGFDDVIVKTEAVDRASSEADSRVQSVKAAEIVAKAMRGYAEDAADKATQAEQDAVEAAATATEARTYAQNAVNEVSSARDAAISRLAQLRNSSVALEQQRQNGLEAARDEQARQALEAAAEQSQADSSAGGEPTSNIVTKPVPRPTTTSDPKPTTTSDPKPTTTSDPKPTTTSDPKPTTTSDPKPTTTSDPKPTATSDPEPEPDPTWKSSSSQGSKAASHSLTLVGKPYSQTLDGGTGPTYYDCSGLTQEAWATAGIYIPRTSSSQYWATTHVPLSEVRPGDLVFWSSNGSGSGVYHIEVYIGGGQVMGAHKPGTPASVSSLYRGGSYNLMAVVGRP